MSNKKAQRTKGNVKPARSEKAASTLASFGDYNPDSFQSNSLLLDEANLNTVDPDLRQCLRRFSKRDASTKCKALSDFMAIIETKEVDCLVVALSHVVRAYNRLAIDNSRRVRELSQRTLELTAGRVGREIAPHLRSLLPIWLLSMNDICAVVSNAARSAFENTFATEAKQHDALWLARRELCAVINSILLRPKDCTLLREDPAKEEAEGDEEETSEGETRSVRVTRAAVRCLGQLAAALGDRLSQESEAVQSFKEDLSSIIGAPRFWKLAHNESPLVRAALLWCVGQLAKHTSLLEPHVEPATRALTAYLNASEPLVCSCAWSALSELLARHGAPVLADASLLSNTLAFVRAGLRSQDACAPAVGALLVKLVCTAHDNASAKEVERPAADTLRSIFGALDEGCTRSAVSEPLVSRLQLDLLQALLSQSALEPPLDRLCIERIETLLQRALTSTKSTSEPLFSLIRTLLQTQTSEMLNQLWLMIEQLISKLYLDSAPEPIDSSSPPNLPALVRFFAVMFSSQSANAPQESRAGRVGVAARSYTHEPLQQVPFDADAARAVLQKLPQSEQFFVRVAGFATELASGNRPVGASTAERAAFVLSSGCLLLRLAPLAPMPTLVVPADTLARRSLALELESASEPLLLQLLEAVFEFGAEQLQLEALESLLSPARSSFLNYLVRAAAGSFSTGAAAGVLGRPRLSSIVAKLCVNAKFVALRRTFLSDSFSLLALDASVVESEQRSELLVHLAAWLALRMPRDAQDADSALDSELSMYLELLTQLRRAYEARALATAASYSSLQQVVPFVRTLVHSAGLETSSPSSSDMRHRVLVEVLAIDMNARLAIARSPSEYTQLWLDGIGNASAPDQMALFPKLMHKWVEIAASQSQLWRESIFDVLVALADIHLSSNASPRTHQLLLQQLLDSVPKRSAKLDLLLRFSNHPEALHAVSDSLLANDAEPLTRSQSSELIGQSLKLYRYYARLVSHLGTCCCCLASLPAAVENICTARVLLKFALALQLVSAESVREFEFPLLPDELLVQHMEPVFAHISSLDSAIGHLVLQELFAASTGARAGASASAAASTASSATLYTRLMELARHRLAAEQTLSTLSAGSAEAERRSALALGVLARASADEATGRATLDWVREAFTNNLRSFALAVQLERETAGAGENAQSGALVEATSWLARLNELPLQLDGGQSTRPLEEAILTLLDAVPLATNSGQEARDWCTETLRFYVRLLSRASPPANRTLHDRLLCRAAELARELCAGDCEPVRLTTNALLLSELVHRVSHALEKGTPALSSSSTSTATESRSSESIVAIRSEWDEFFSPRLLEPLAVLFFVELRAVASGSSSGTCDRELLSGELQRARLVHLTRALHYCTHKTLLNAYHIVTSGTSTSFSFPLPSVLDAEPDASGAAVRGLYARLVTALVQTPSHWPVDSVTLWQVLVHQLVLHVVPRLSAELKDQGVSAAAGEDLGLSSVVDIGGSRTTAEEPAESSSEDADADVDEEAHMHPMQSAFERLQLPTVLESRPLPDAIITEIAKCEPPVFEFCDQQQQQPSGSLSRDIPTSLKPKMLSYLLLWNVALAYLKCAESTRRRQYVRWLSESGVLQRFMTCVFKMLPDPPVISPRTQDASTFNSSNSTTRALNLFESAQRTCCALRGAPLLERAACQLFLETLREMPVLARDWHSRLDRRAAELVARYTADYVSPTLCALELAAVRQQRFQVTAPKPTPPAASTGAASADVPASGSIEIRTRPAAREVIATYTLQEGVTNEIVVELPLTYPLAPLVVKSGQRAGISESLWRKWTLQLTAFLQNQNGSIVESVGMWRRSVERALADVSECSICLAVLHPDDWSLPRLRCHTCRKRFHARCLYTWFQSSSAATCPLCRSVF